jgi:hypothetical protein
MKHTLTHNENGVAHLHIHIPAFASASEAEETAQIQAQVNQAIEETLSQAQLRLWSQPSIADIEPHVEGTEVSVLIHHFPPFDLDLSQISVPVPEVPVITPEHIEQRLRQ